MAVVATKNQDDALDLVQETMLKLVQKYSSKPESAWPPLFFRILQSRILDYHRRNTVRRRWRVWLSDRYANAEDYQEDPLLNFADARQPGIEQQLSSDEDYLVVQQAITNLPLRQQQALTLRAWEWLSVADTAFVMECSEGSVKTHYSRAVGALRKRLEAHNE